jgi:hypothetical protein
MVDLLKPINVLLVQLLWLAVGAAGPEDASSSLVILTGANHAHFWTLLNLLDSVAVHEPAATVVTYDLGLTEAQRLTLRASYKAPRHVHRRFAFERFPAHFAMEGAGSNPAGEYAWKPTIIHAALEEFGARGGDDAAQVAWLDAGCALRRPLVAWRASVAARGFHSPRSVGTVAQWTHAGTLRHFGLIGGGAAADAASADAGAAGAGGVAAVEVVGPAAAAETLRYRMLSAGLVGLRYGHAGVRELVREWAACALRKECIAPAGSSRANHRQDQSALSILAQRFGYDEEVDIRDPQYELAHQQGKVLKHKKRQMDEELGECI